MVVSLLAGIVLTDGAGLDDLVVMPIMPVPQLAVCSWILLSGRYRTAGPATPQRTAAAASDPKPAGATQRK